MRLSTTEARAMLHVPMELREKFAIANRRLKHENTLEALEAFRIVVKQIEEKRR